jgi:hypothetical protein
MDFMTMRPFDPHYSTRRWLKLGLAISGAIAGAVFGIVLTRIGKVVAGAPPATLANYAWNAALFGVMAGFVSPIVAWSVLRRVPLWRTIIEPLGLAVAGGCAAVVLGVPALILVGPPAGLALGFYWLQRRYPDPDRLLLAASDHELANEISPRDRGLHDNRIPSRNKPTTSS